MQTTPGRNCFAAHKCLYITNYNISHFHEYIEQYCTVHTHTHRHIYENICILCIEMQKFRFNMKSIEGILIV